MQGIISLIVGGSLIAGAGLGQGFIPMDLIETEREELTNAKIEAVSILTEEEKEFAASLEGKKGKELTIEEREQMREIMDKVHTETKNNITNPELQEKMEEHKTLMDEKRAERRASGGRHKRENRNEEM